MNRLKIRWLIRFGLTILLTLVLATSGAGQKGEASPAAVPVQLDPGPYFVGQAVEVRVESPPAVRDRAPSRLIAPQPVGADLIPIRGSAPGRLVRFWLVPHRVGPLVVPPFRTEATGGGQSPSVRITVGAIPLTGRPSAFGGGVGAFRVGAQLDASTVRPGRAVGFALTLTGLAAVGRTMPPDLSAWARRPDGIEARPLGSDLDPTDPPTRTFRYELRPRRAGRLTIPPVLVASFDPTSGRFSTRSTTSLTLEVPPPPRFDPSTIRPPEHWSPPSSEGRRDLVGIGAATGLILATLVASAGWHRRPPGLVRATRWRREAQRLARLDPDAPGWAEGVAARFERLLAASLQRPLAALTPPEAAAATRELTGDDDLANRANRFVMALDRLRFEPTGDDRSEQRARLRAEAIALVRATASQVKRPTGWLGRFERRADGSRK